MKHRERVQMALAHETPDRCPMQISFTPEFAARLRGDPRMQAQLAQSPGLGTMPQRAHNPHGGGNTYALERALDEDMLLTSVGWANSYYANATYNPGGDSYADEWGVAWRNCAYTTRFGSGHYTEMIGHPLADDAALQNYRPPDPHRPELYVEAAHTIDAFRDTHWIVGVTVCTIWETAWALRGMERLMMDLVTNPEVADHVLEIPLGYHLAAAEQLVRMGVDMIWIGDDIGAQHAMVMSPDTWRRFLKPRLATFVATLKALDPGIVIAYHTDGVAYPVIPELIELGIDVLNPVQPACMDPARVKALYGDRLSFWGSIDEQHTLPFGTPDDVRREVHERLCTLGRGGGLIIGPTHHVQLDTPLENLWALVDAVRETPYGAL